MNDQMKTRLYRARKPLHTIITGTTAYHILSQVNTRKAFTRYSPPPPPKQTDKNNNSKQQQQQQQQPKNT